MACILAAGIPISPYYDQWTDIQSWAFRVPQSKVDVDHAIWQFILDHPSLELGDKLQLSKGECRAKWFLESVALCNDAYHIWLVRNNRIRENIEDNHLVVIMRASLQA